MDVATAPITRARRSMGGILAALFLLAACGSDADVSATTSGVPDASTPEITSSETTTAAPTSTGDSSNGPRTMITSKETRTSEASGADEVVLEAILTDLLVSEGVETVGCWFHQGEGIDGAVLYFSGYDGGFFLIDGTLVQVDKPNGKSFGVEQGVVYSNEGFEAEFTTLGEPVSTSIESTEQQATLAITPTDRATTKYDGTLRCGV